MISVCRLQREKTVKETKVCKGHYLQLEVGHPVPRTFQYPGEKDMGPGSLHRTIRRQHSRSKATIKDLATLAPRLIVLRYWQEPTQFHPVLHQLRIKSIILWFAHVVEWRDRAVRVNLAGSFEQIFGGLDGIQHNNDSPEDVERQNIPCRTYFKQNGCQSEEPTIFLGKFGVSKPG
jgi:hypothetical protein